MNLLLLPILVFIQVLNDVIASLQLPDLLAVRSTHGQIRRVLCGCEISSLSISQTFVS